MRPYRADTAATVSQEPQAQICTLLSLFFKQQLRELEKAAHENISAWTDGNTRSDKKATAILSKEHTLALEEVQSPLF